MADEYFNAMVNAAQNDFDDREARNYIDDEVDLINFESPAAAEACFMEASQRLREAVKRQSDLIDRLDNLFFEITTNGASK